MRPEQEFLIEAIFDQVNFRNDIKSSLTLNELISELKQLEREIDQTTYFLVSSPGVTAPDLDKADLLDSIESLNQEFPNWTLASAAGEIGALVGGTGDNIVDYLSGPGHKFQTTGEAFIAEVVYLERFLFRLKPRNLQTPNLASLIPETVFGDGTSSLPNLKQGTCLISPSLAAWSTNKSDVRRRSVKIKDSTLSKDRNHVGNVARNPVKLAIVTRTRWTRIEQLQRNIQSIRALSVESNLNLQVEHVIVSDCEPIGIELPNDIVFKFAQGFEVDDSRFLLVDFAAKNVSADFYWFIDDDDFVESDSVELIGKSLFSRNSPGLTFVGSQQVIEQKIFNNISFAIRGHLYQPKNYIASFSETNQIPFCSIIFPRQSLISININRALDRLTHLEDHYLLIKALAETSQVPLLINRPLVWVSVRPLSANDRELRRNIRTKSHANLVWLWATSGDLANQGLLAASFETGKSAGSAALFMRTFAFLLNPRTWVILWGNGMVAELFESSNPIALIRNWFSRLKSK